MPTFIRFSPSGPVSLESAPQDSNSVENRSTVPGATFTDALNGIDSDISELETVTAVDDFQGGPDSFVGLASEGVFGDTGWSFNSSSALGSISRPTDQQYMGAYAITAPPSAISGFTYASNNSQDGIDFPSSLFTFVEFLVCPNIGDSPSAGSFRAGLGVSADLTNFGVTGLFVEVARAVNDNWRFVTRVVSANTVIPSTIPFAPHALTRVRLSRDLLTGAWTASINGVDIGSFTSAQVSGTRVISGIQVESAAGSAQSMSIDRYSMGMRAALF